MITIRRASQIYEIAEIRVWCLVRLNKISYQIIRGCTMVNHQEIAAYISKHPNLLHKMQQDLQTVRR